MVATTLFQGKRGSEYKVSKIFALPSGQIDVEAKSIQRRGRRRNDVDFRSKTQIESTLIYRRRNHAIESTSKRRYQIDVETTSLNRR